MFIFALADVLVEEADALVLGDERGPVLHLLVRDHALVGFLDEVLEPPARGVQGQYRRVGVVPLAESKDFAKSGLRRHFDKSELELELELIQYHMAQEPVLRGEVGCACVAREVSVERGGKAL